MSGRIYVGTSSFADKSVLPYFYPKEVKPHERISYYSQFFDTVEIDSSFYGLPSYRNSLLFVQRTPSDFVIHFKAFRLMTKHPTPVASLGRTLRSFVSSEKSVIYGFESEEMMTRCFQFFWSALEPLKNCSKLGFVLFQFPPWFKKSHENVSYLYRIRELLPEAKIAIEFRNGTWVLKSEIRDTMSLLKELEFTFVTVDEPQVGIYGSIPAIFELTSEEAYLRFHGRNREAWLKKGATVQEKFRYLYSENELEPYAKRVKELALDARNIYVFFNNCFAYYALKNAKMFAEMVGALTDRKPLKLFLPDDESGRLLF